MARPKFDSEQGRAAGVRSAAVRAQAKQSRDRSQLTLATVEAQLPLLTSLVDAKSRLDRVGTWAAAGMLPGVVAMSVVRSVEVWVRTHEAQLTQEVAQQLRRRVEELEAELQRSRVGIVR